MSTRLGFGRAALVLALGLLWTQACTENAPEPTGGLLTDFASGVDADFGVEAFAVNEPSLTINAPTHKQQFAKGATATPAELAFTVAFHDLAADKGKIRCYLDNKEVLTTIKTNDAATNTIADLGAPGLKTITCVLLDAAGNKLENAEAFAKRYVYVTKACQVSNECDDGMACSQESCIGNKCLYEPIESCCANSLECNVGETCNSPNTIDAKCSACSGDIDCDDGNACTTDSCDLSGIKGQCKNVKTDPECCIAADTECDDGLLCTVDKCTPGNPTGKCTHTKPDGVCCADSDCVSTDSCLVGSCVDFECRFGPDVSKPDCCSDTYNTACNDNYVCTIDKCETDKGGWKQCTHTKDPDKPDCCDPFNSTNECQDGNSCTYDVCYNNACIHKEIAECCVTDKDCFDDHLCTQDTCEIKPGDTAGICKYPKTDPECCVTFLDCDDGLLCTQDTCDTVNNKCKHELVGNGCCDKDEQCDDGKFCTVGQCVNHGCVFGPDITKPACCDANSDCNDNDACTLNSCDVASHTCKYVDNGDSNCCNANEDCDDNNCATLDFCDATNQCVAKADPTKCTTNLECDDQDPCTIDACDKSGDCGTCIHTKDPQCCVMDANCEDGDICTTDVCVDNKCQSSAKANCCVDDDDALTACDDNNSCTIEYCANNTCRHTVPKGGCCASNSDCFDGDSCTLDKCQNIVDGKGTCAFTKDPLKPDCVCTEQNAKLGLDCNDLNPCTVDSCIGGVCAHSNIDGCCLDKFDCDDGQPCTSDFCVLKGCVHAEYGGENALCCSPATQDTDCAYLNTACSKGVCETQPDNSRACVSQPVDICTVQVSYCQDFATGSTLKAMGWNPGDISGSAKGNWKLATKGPLGPDQHASLSWTPTYTNYDTCLQSPILQAAGTKTITLQYDQLIDLAKFGDTSVRLLGSLDGANVDWTKATLIDIVTPKADSGPATLDVTLPPELTGSNGLRLAFCVAGKTTFDVTNYGLDNICVAKGGKPSLKACPVNQIVKLFGSKSVPLKASDPDADAILSFSMVKGPSFVTLSSAFYYWFDSTWNSTLTINPQTYADVGTHEITIKVSDG
ncbi:MAG: extracellular matrix protein, partial [Pseudomonadota bacterium]